MALGASAPSTTAQQGVWSKWRYDGKKGNGNVNLVLDNGKGAFVTAQLADAKQAVGEEQHFPKGSGEGIASVKSRDLLIGRSLAEGCNDLFVGCGFLTPEVVAQHNTEHDCWIIINDRVYDVTEFGKMHPGGPVIYTQAGRDATDYFRVFHSAKAWTYLQRYCVGDLHNAGEKRQGSMPQVVKDYRELRTILSKARLFESNKFYYVCKCLGNLAILAASLWMIGTFSNFWAVLCSAFLLALFWQQSGWLSHDFLHHQVTENRGFNTVVGGLIWGNLLQGYSVSWWKTKHNVHHAATNQCDEKYQPIDPDIDTVPLLAWSKDILATVDDEYFRGIIKIQHFLFLPMMTLARFSWLHSSWTHVSQYEMSKAMRILEKTCIVLHHTMVTSVALWLLPLPMAVGWVVLSQLFCGLLLSIVFVISHNGMDVYNDPARDFVTAQVCTTRNIRGSLFNDWFTGGLNRQIEHHLFPSLPRHNLKKVAPFVKGLCEKHSIPYEELSLWGGIVRAFKTLVEVAQAV